MSKDKIYGYGIFIVTIIFLILYTIYLPIQQYFGAELADLISLLNPLKVTPMDAVLWPVYLATLMIGFIIAWIGITMATTPPPEPIDLDDLNLDEEDLDDDKDDDD
ncbi:MAG: hypothetical protein EAX86_08160 [Candidatus Heimdallarchaeota archaeon]|nr:hypothetical protein [Candidatus Heimdallarchaeota archaeon]